MPDNIMLEGRLEFTFGTEMLLIFVLSRLLVCLILPLFHMNANVFLLFVILHLVHSSRPKFAEPAFELLYFRVQTVHMPPQLVLSMRLVVTLVALMVLLSFEVHILIMPVQMVASSERTKLTFFGLFGQFVVNGFHVILKQITPGGHVVTLSACKVFTLGMRRIHVQF